MTKEFMKPLNFDDKSKLSKGEKFLQFNELDETKSLKEVYDILEKMQVEIKQNQKNFLEKSLNWLEEIFKSFIGLIQNIGQSLLKSSSKSNYEKISAPVKEIAEKQIGGDSKDYGI